MCNPQEIKVRALADEKRQNFASIRERERENFVYVLVSEWESYPKTDRIIIYEPMCGFKIRRILQWVARERKRETWDSHTQGALDRLIGIIRANWIDSKKFVHNSSNSLNAPPSADPVFVKTRMKNKLLFYANRIWALLFSLALDGGNVPMVIRSRTSVCIINEMNFEIFAMWNWKFVPK